MTQPIKEGAGEPFLKPCPFCGGAAIIERHGTRHVSMIIECEDCGARVESGDVWGCTMPDHFRWNRRAPAPQPEAPPHV